MNIKNVVLDLGGIIVSLDYDEMFRQFSELLDMEINKDNVYEIIGDNLHKIEKNEVSIEGFIWKIQSIKGGNVDPGKIIKAFNSILLDVRPEIFPFLKELKRKYNLFLLSNTNTIHIQKFLLHILEKKHNIRRKDWDDLFHTVYYSHDLGMRKPDHEIYNEVAKRENLKPEETIFIDDTIENVTAAIECGWHSVHHDPSLKIEEHINQYIEDCESLERNRAK
jgi:putative hydrolase of the HAD superfamily